MMALPEPPNMNYAWAGLLVDELVRLGVAGFVISPGSRNAPLAVSVARHPGARHWVHFDERGAGFFALGLARQTGRPAVLISTSGSATANYWPAVVEADAANTPLIVITADRPPELLDCGANQAIDQPRLFGRYIRWEATLPCPDAAIDPAYVLTTADQAHARAMAPEAGPVHLNCMFREPLAPRADGSVPPDYLASLAGWRAGTGPYTRIAAGAPRLPDGLQAELLDAVQTCTRGLLVFGALHSPSDTARAAALARALGWPVFADICSGLRGGYTDLPGLLDHGDLCLLDGDIVRDWQPDLVLHIGGSMTSKRYQQAIARWRTKLIRVHAAPARLDPDHRVLLRCTMAPGDFCAWLAACMTGHTPADPPVSWMQRNANCGATLREWEGEQESLGEILAARIVAAATPPHSLMFLGNSMPVRLIDTFGCPDAPDIVVAANRGASGIDGNIATAAGMALAANRPAVVLLGDLTTLHDLNSLDLMRNIGTPFVLVVLNNDGGGIFHHLPIAAEQDVFEACFGTPHGLNFAAAATLFKIPYQNPADIGAFREAYARAMETPGPALIELTLERYASQAAHVAMRDRLCEAMRRPAR